MSAPRELGPPENATPGRRIRAQKRSGEDSVSALTVPKIEPRVKRLIREHHRLKVLETFIGHRFWAIHIRRGRIADELARRGIHPFDKPSTGGAR
jgi:hypothetical protein